MWNPTKRELYKQAIALLAARVADPDDLRSTMNHSTTVLVSGLFHVTVKTVAKDVRDTARGEPVEW